MTQAIRILVVDDEPAIAAMLKAAAEQVGWKATKAFSAEEAGKLIDNESFELYVFDKNLPDGSGVDLVRKVREKSEAAVCVMITAYASPESAKETLRLGVNAYIEKPFDNINDIIARLDDLLTKADVRGGTVEPRTADRPLKVLIATPDAPSRTWLGERFTAYGDELVSLDSSRDVVARVRELEPDLVILDAALTEPDVRALMAWVDARAIVMLTRSAPATREIIQYIDLNVKAVLERPLTDVAFGDEMDGLLWRLRTRRQ